MLSLEWGVQGQLASYLLLACSLDKTDASPLESIKNTSRVIESMKSVSFLTSPRLFEHEDAFLFILLPT